jgi:hypothetical protein
MDRCKSWLPIRRRERLVAGTKPALIKHSVAPVAIRIFLIQGVCAAPALEHDTNKPTPTTAFVFVATDLSVFVAGVGGVGAPMVGLETGPFQDSGQAVDPGPLAHVMVVKRGHSTGSRGRCHHFHSLAWTRRVIKCY